MTCKPGIGVRRVEMELLLPHELFSLSFHHDKKAFDEIFAIDEAHRTFWQKLEAVREPWFVAHPYRDKVLELGERATPMRVFGDKTGLRKTRNVAIMHWSSQGAARNWDIRKTRCPIYAVPAHLLIKDLTEPALQSAVAWSIEALQSGRFPCLNHLGKRFPERSWRGRMAGQPLADGRCAIYTGSVADWEWNRDTFGFKETWSTEEICHRCFATRLPGAANFCNFSRCDRRCPDGFKAASRSPLVIGISGWHVDNVMAEAMHSGPLGVSQHLNASVLLELCEEGLWPHGGSGSWDEKLASQLSIAFDEFVSWARSSHKAHNHKRFTPLNLSMKRKSDWSLLKSKARNSLVIQEWLVHKARDGIEGDDIEYKKLRAAVQWGFYSWFNWVRKEGEWLSDPAKAGMSEAADFMFKGYNALSVRAATYRRARYKIVPEHHQLWHSPGDAIRTGRNPAHHWSFPEESNMKVLGDIAANVHGSTVSRRTLERWLAQLFV